MALNKYKEEEILEISMIEIAFELMKEEKQPFAFGDLVKRVAEIKKMNESEVMDRISYLYTDLNIDGRFICLGENRWGLRTWYPYEQADEEITPTVRRKRAKKADEDEEEVDIDLEDEFEDLDEELEDEFEDLEDELDEIVNEENEDSEFDIELDEEETEEVEDDLDEDVEDDDEFL